MDAFFDLAIRINAAPPCTPITVVWNQDLPHYDSTCFEDLGYHVAYSEIPSDAHERGSYTAWRPDYRPWVGTDKMIALSVPGMVFCVLTGEYGDLSGWDRWQKSKGKWVR